MATPDLISIIVQIVHLRQAGVPRRAVEELVARERDLPRHAARRLIGHVEEELLQVRHRLGLRLALTAESLHDECVEPLARVPSHN